MIKKYIEDIGNNRNIEDMEKLGNMLYDIICDMKESHHELYEKYKMELYELAYGEVINEDMAHTWVKSMKPVGKHWTMEETTNAMHEMGYNCDDIEFYVVANMIYNDYYDLVRDNEEMALQLAYSWLNDEDSKEHKLYRYWKNIIKRD